MADNVVGISLEAKLEAFRQQMSQVEGITADQAKAMAAQFSKEIKAAEAAAKKASEAAKKAAKGTQDVGDAAKKAAEHTKAFGDAAGKAGGNSAKLAGFLSLISPEAAEAARTMADLADVGEVAAVGAEAAGVAIGELALVLGPATLVLGAAAAAFMVHSRNAEMAADRTALLSREAQALTAVSNQAADAQLRLAVAMGRISESGAKQIQIYRDATRQVAELARSQEEERTAAEEALDWNSRVSSSLEDLALTGHTGAIVISNLADYLGGFSEKADAAAIKLADLNESFEDQRGAIHQTAKADKEAEEAAEKKRLADEKAKAAAEARAKAEKKLAEALAAQERAFESLQEAAAIQNEHIAEMNAGIQALLDDAKKTNDSMLEGEAKLTQEYEDQTQAIGKKTAALLLASQSEIERTNIQIASQRDLDAHTEKYYADLDAQRKKDSEAAKKASQEKVDAEKAALTQLYTDGASLAADAAGRMADSFGAAYDSLTVNVTDLMNYQSVAEEYLTDSQKKELKAREKEQKKAARAAFNAQKAAAMATAAVNTALAVSQALGSAPWPYSLIPAGFALAGGLAEEAAIASTQPAFHKGGPLDLAPDEMSITARNQEYMLNPTGRSMYGDEELSKANAGMQPSSSGNVYAVSVYKHTRQVDRWKSDGLLQGDPISKAIQAGKLVGHRSR